MFILFKKLLIFNLNLKFVFYLFNQIKLNE